MIDIFIDNEARACPTSWEDITLERALAIYDFLRDCPEDLINTLIETPGGQLLDFRYEWSGVVCPLLAEFTGVPSEIWGNASPEVFTGEAGERFGFFARGLLSGHPGCEIPDVSEFTIGDKSFRVPGDGVDINGDPIPGQGLSAGSFCDMTELYCTDKIKYASHIVSLVCDDLTAHEFGLGWSARRFLSVTMDKVWNVLALLPAIHAYMMNEFPECYARDAELSCSGLFTHPAIGWSELPYLAARYSFSSISEIRNMDCYDFMKILNVGIKTGFY